MWILHLYYIYSMQLQQTKCCYTVQNLPLIKNHKICIMVLIYIVQNKTRN
jgi:hypothetical protein